MRIIVSSLLFATVLGSVAFGQDPPRAEVFGGYSYLNIDTNGLTSRQSANGWEASIAGNFNRWFAVEGDVAGYYKTYSFDFGLAGIVPVNVHDYSYAAGPRFNFRPLFVHALLGVDHLTGSSLGFSVSQDSFAAVFGGGVQWKIAPRWAIRGSGDYALTRHNIFGSPLQTYTQNNFRASVGVVYLFGVVEPRASRSITQRSQVSASGCNGTMEAALLGVSGCNTDNGFRVTSVRDGSPASSAGIIPGDIVTAIDGRAVRDAREIELAIGVNTSGLIKISYMIQNKWLTERDAKVH